jgi:hypothetical protein
MVFPCSRAVAAGLTTLDSPSDLIKAPRWLSFRFELPLAFELSDD